MPQLGLGIGSQISGGKLTIYDTDALTYINAVQAADGQSLENGIKIAINDFVVGCKSDGIWTSIVNSCIMAGANTLSGALIPLVGTAPGNVGFTSSDYNRKTGLIGNGTSKYLATAYNNTVLPTDNDHLSCYVTQAPTIGAATKIFIGTATGSGGRLYIACNTTSGLNFKNRTSLTAGITIANEGITTGFKGNTRSGPTSTIFRTSQANTSDATASTTLISQTIGIFAATTPVQYTDARMSFYSLGTNIDLALLDSRITTFMNTLNSILP